MALWMHSRKRKLAGLGIGVILLVISIISSVLFGLHQYTVYDIWLAYSQFNGSNEHLIIRTARVPRALIAAAVGACLAIAGAIMQVITKNPLASPSIFGINAGAALFIVTGLTVFGSSLTMGSMIWMAFAGAAATSAFVYALGVQEEAVLNLLN